MKKNSLTTALLAGLAGAAGLATTAHAVNLNPDGLGQALIYPYYTVNGGNQTLLSVVNTADNVKAVKVRVLESRNSREVIDFNLYLSAFDVWTGTIFTLDATGNGAGNLITLDRSCTVPAIFGNTTLPTVNGNRYVPFRNFGYTGSFADGGGSGLDRTREGHFEMIEMGILQNGTGAGQLAEEATHVNSVPLNCSRLVAAWSQNPVGVWAGTSSQNAANTTNSPTGGLFGAAAVVDVVNGTMLAYNAEAIDGFFFTGNDADDLHFPPGNTLPTLNNARTSAALSPVTSYVFSSGPTSSVIQSSWARGIDAVSATYMVDALYNEYATAADVGAESEWVINFPTKRFYVDHTAFGGPANLPSAGNGFRFALPPFAGLGFTRSTTAGLSASFACEDVSFDLYDREENIPFQPVGVDFSPPEEVPGTINSLCEETNVISFAQAGTSTEILGSRRFLNLELPAGFVDGWLKLGFPANSDTGETPGYVSLDGDVYIGLPATGFWAVNVINSNATPGKIANYSAFFKHRGSRDITPSGSVLAD